ncbi:5161_t:CDS:10 [Diversispora eburnea]|uniref:5161_t:CDS:1 n=1 Tax=Diversispora eburnea TaxID=1213867 RepID=A0A9N9BCV6_9GLOM|nr:5161_t:CDS:10 [Diversispora eburnea]
MPEDGETSGGSETQITQILNDAIHIAPSSSSIYSRNFFNYDKVLGIFGGMWLNVNLMIGSGIYATPGQVMKLTGSGGMTLIMYVIGFFYVMIGSFIYVELGSTISESGGEQIYFEKAFPNPKKMVAYIFSFSTIVKYRLVAFGIISIVTVYHLFSNKVAVWINQILAVIKVLTLFGVVIIGFTKMKNINIHSEKFFGNTKEIKYYNNYSSSMLKVLFAYSGWNTLNYSLDEMRNPKKRLRISNPASVLIVGILLTVPKEYIDQSTPEIMSAKLGDVIGSAVAISILIAISCFGAVGSDIWGNSRLIASVAKAGFIPAFSPVLQKFDERWNTPFNALIFQWCYLTFIICLPLDKPYDALVNMSQNTYIIFYFMSAIGLLVLRETEPDRERPFRIDTSWVYLFIFFSLAIFVGVRNSNSTPPESVNSNTLT